MVLSVCVKLNDIFEQGKGYRWIKPDRCPRCGSVRLWGHGFVGALFDGFNQALLLRRYRCPDCRCIVRMKPAGYFARFQASAAAIRNCLTCRLCQGKWPGSLLSTSRQRHWLSALKRKVAAVLGCGVDLLAGFDRLVKKRIIPVSRAI